MSFNRKKSFKRHGFAVFALVVVGTLVALVEPGYVAERLSPLFSRTPIADPAPAPCEKQSWYNADRVCLSWTAPR